MSRRPDSSRIARSTSRPMRPNPLIATRMVMLFLLMLFAERREGRSGRGFGGDAEMLVKILVRRAGAEAVHADECA